MDYEFDYIVDPFEMTKLALKGIYKSLAGAVNIVFTISAIGLLMRFWFDLNVILKTFLFLCVFMFPLFQPLIIYNRLKKQLSNLPNDMKAFFFFFIYSNKERLKGITKGGKKRPASRRSRKKKRVKGKVKIVINFGSRGALTLSF